MISNSTPLILLSRINKLEFLKKLFGKIVIPESVKEEISIPSKPGYEIIKKAIETKLIVVLNPKTKLDLNLGKDENDAVALAKEKKETLIMDDAYAIKAAKAYDVNIIRTTTVIFMAHKKEMINKRQAIDLLTKLLEEGYYIKPAEYAAIINRLDKF